VDILNYRVAWVHGIGHAPAGYSNSWRKAFNASLNFPDGDYIEVLWSTVFGAMMRAMNLTEPVIPLTPQEQAAEVDVRSTLETILLTRRPTIAPVQGMPLIREWANSIATRTIALPDWVLDPQDYIGEFSQYLASRRVRSAVKERFKQQLRPLAGRGYAISIIAHSWGTVVAYESLIDLEVDQPNLKLANLFTLGSPLWMVRYWLDERSGRKPRNIGKWINVDAEGDVIGAGLRPGFQVDKDFAVPNFQNAKEPHNSYFLSGNTVVQHDIVAATVKG
jgi:metacaspase-1